MCEEFYCRDDQDLVTIVLYSPVWKAEMHFSRDWLGVHGGNIHFPSWKSLGDFFWCWWSSWSHIFYHLEWWHLLCVSGSTLGWRVMESWVRSWSGVSLEQFHSFIPCVWECLACCDWWLHSSFILILSFPFHLESLRWFFLSTGALFVEPVSLYEAVMPCYHQHCPLYCCRPCRMPSLASATCVCAITWTSSSTIQTFIVQLRPSPAVTVDRSSNKSGPAGAMRHRSMAARNSQGRRPSRRLRSLLHWPGLRGKPQGLEMDAEMGRKSETWLVIVYLRNAENERPRATRHIGSEGISDKYWSQIVTCVPSCCTNCQTRLHIWCLGIVSILIEPLFRSSICKNVQAISLHVNVVMFIWITGCNITYTKRCV